DILRSPSAALACVLHVHASRPMVLSEKGAAESAHDRHARVAEMMARYLGEPLMAGFADDDVTEVYLNPQDGHVRYDTRSSGKLRTSLRLQPQRVEQFLNAVADMHGLAVGGDQTSLQAELPQEFFRGARLQGFLPPMASGACFVIRKPPAVVYSLDDY